MGTATQRKEAFGWSDDSLDIAVEVDAAGIARMDRLAAPPAPASVRAGIPLLDVILTGAGRAWSGRRYCESVVGQRMRYQGHEDHADGNGWRLIRAELADPVTGLRAEIFYRILVGHGVLRSWVRLTNAGAAKVTVESVTTFLCGGLSGGDSAPDDLSHLDVLWCENDWQAEGRWQRRELRDALPDLARNAHGTHARGRFGITSTGTWSSGTYLPMGAVVDHRTGHTWLWQIEHNGAWHWQVGECAHRGAGGAPGHGGLGDRRSGVYVAILGPTDTEHHWHVTLAPGETFSTVPAAVAVSARGLDDAFGLMTGYRRAVRRPHGDSRRLPVIFNDFMNTLMGDPTTARLLPLITAAAAVGAEYFCIDAGWYAEPGQGWWDSVGEWEPSAARFPGGISEVMDRVRAEGMVPGLWLEPEVVGVRSPIADRLPAEAFFLRRGQRVVENGRYHLDLRHPAALTHLDEAIDFLVGELGVGYLKLDYNINAGPGTDTGGLSAGAGLLAHNRAHLRWLNGVLDRHPGLVIENCASGGMRTDYAMLSGLQLQSTSDQQDLLRYPAITAAAPAAITPEQAATWAYPQPGFTDREIIFTLCGALLGRIHLSGHIDQMTTAQRRLVADAVDTYKQIRHDLPAAVPFWPFGLPRWTDSWLALGMRAPTVTYLLVWHRGRMTPKAPGTADGDQVVLPTNRLGGETVAPEVLYPRAGRPLVSWDPRHCELTVKLPDTPSVCLVQLIRRRSANVDPPAHADQA